MASFLVNPWMLTALAAVAIPIIIEILFRRRRRQVELPSIRFLLKNPEEKKIRRQDRLLLLLRCMVPFFLVWALARPVLNPKWAGAKKRHVILLLDSTISMGQQAGVSTAFALAKNKASELIRILPAATPLTLITLGHQARVEIERDTDLYAARETVEALKISHGAATLSEAIPALEKAIAGDSQGETAELYVFSDFQKTTWLRRAGGQPDPIEDVRKLGAKAEIFFVDVGGSRQFNYYITRLAPQEPFIVAGKTMDFLAVVEARGKPPGPEPRARLTFLVNGEKKGMDEISLESGERSVVFGHRFPEAGEYLVQVEVEGDNHRLDNSRYYLASVPDAFHVLILDENAAGSSSDAETRFLQAAIAPTPRPGLDRFSIFDCLVIPPSEIVRENLANYCCVLVMGLPRVPEDAVAKIEPYVRDGGNVLFFAGSRVNTWEYNQKFYNAGKGLLPAELVGYEAASSNAPLSLKPAAEPHPMWAFFGQQKTFEDAPVTGWMGMKARDGVRVAAVFSNGKPALVERPYGRGAASVFCASPAPPENYLPASPDFPVFIQEMLRYFVGNPDRAVNLETGAAFEQDVMVSAQHLLLRKPDGTKVRLTPQKATGQEQLCVVFNQTDRMGLHEIEASPGVIQRRRFVVNLKVEEGDLDRLEEGELRRMAAARFVRPGESIEALTQERYAAKEATTALLWLLGALLVTESVTAARYGRRRI